jgi:SAM-dependent methyltransferase
MIDAAKFDAWYDSPLGRACFEKEERLLLEDGIPKGSGRVLEVGCGTGRFLLSLTRKSSDIVGVDRDLLFLDFAKRKGDQSGLQLKLIQADVSELPFREREFDVVYEMTSLCFMKDEERAIQQMVRACSESGKILLGELNPASPWQWWRRLKGWFGYGSFKEVKWQWPSSLKRVLKEKGCQVISVQGAIFFPPLNIGNYLHWRGFFEWIGTMLWPWAGAFYLITAIKQRKDR